MPGQPRPGGNPAEAFQALRDEVRALRLRIEAGPGPEADAAEPADTDTLAGLAQSVRTLESYLSIGFFDRVRAAIAESAESLRPVALEKRVAGLRRLVWLLLLLQLGTLGLLAVLNAPEIAALAGVAASP
jgi:hypothetical protein